MYVSVIIMCMHSALIGGEQQSSFLMKAYDMGLTNGRYVFIPYDTLLYSLPYTNTTYFPLQNNTKLRKAYDAVLTVTVESDLMSFNEAFNMAKRLGELVVSQEPEQVWVVHFDTSWILFVHSHKMLDSNILLHFRSLLSLVQSTTVCTCLPSPCTMPEEQVSGSPGPTWPSTRGTSHFRGSTRTSARTPKGTGRQTSWSWILMAGELNCIVVFK